VSRARESRRLQGGCAAALHDAKYALLTPSVRVERRATARG